MRYTVIALPEAEEELARIWMEAPDSESVSFASHQIDVMLKYDPLMRGREYDELRILTVEPLSVVYYVLPEDCQVVILQYIFEG